MGDILRRGAVLENHLIYMQMMYESFRNLTGNGFYKWMEFIQTF